MLTLIFPRLNTEVCYRVKFGRRLNLEHPHTMNEKILWLKLNTYLNNPMIRQCADKLRVRDYLMERGFGGLLNELLGVYERVEDIDWDALPDQFVLKLNVGCGHDPRNYSKASYGGHRAPPPEQAVLILFSI